MHEFLWKAAEITLSRNAGEGGPVAKRPVGEGASYAMRPSPSQRGALGPSLSRSAGEGLYG